MQANTNKTGCRGCHCDLEQHMSCLNYAFVYAFRQVPIRSTGCFYFVGALLFCDDLQTHFGALLLGRVLQIGTLRYLNGGLNQRTKLLYGINKIGCKQFHFAIVYVYNNVSKSLFSYNLLCICIRNIVISWHRFSAKWIMTVTKI